MKKALFALIVALSASPTWAGVTTNQATAVKDKYKALIQSIGRTKESGLAGYTAVWGIGVGLCPDGKGGYLPGTAYLRIYVFPEQATLVKNMVSSEIEGVPVCILAENIPDIQ